MASTSTNSQLSAPDVQPTAPEEAQIHDQAQAQDSTTVSEDHQSQPQILSKNAQKKLRKAELFAERKLERRAREKEKKKEKKRERAERIAAGEEEEGPEDDVRAKKRAKLNHGLPRKAFGARVVVDLGFDDKMSEKVRSFFLCPFLPSQWPPFYFHFISWSLLVEAWCT